MWENFDEATRRAVFSAVFEANERNQSGVDTELLLLGLIVSEAPALTLLAQLGVDREALQAATEAAIVVSPIPATEAHGLTVTSKRVLDLAIEEAVAQQDPTVRTEHLLIALVREEGAAARLLKAQGLNLDRLRAAVA